MAEIKLSWEEYQEAALAELKRKYPNVGSVKFFKQYDYADEGKHYDFPTSVYIEIIDLTQPQ